MATRKKKTRHGATQPESARVNAQVLLRLPADATALLDELAAGSTRSATVARLVRRASGILPGCIEPRCSSAAVLHDRCRYCYEAWSDTSGT